MNTTKEKIVAEIIANEIIHDLNSPSIFRAYFGNSEDRTNYKKYWKEKIKIQEDLINKLELIDKS